METSPCFQINNDLLALEIKIEEISNLHRHEEIILDYLHKLIEDIKSDGYIRHPIIVDKKTLVVLDGMHRLVAMKTIGCRFIPICVVDYNNANIIVECWHRVINHSSDFERLIGSIKELGLNIKLRPKMQAIKYVKERRSIYAIISHRKSYSVHDPQKNTKDIYEAIKQTENKLTSRRFVVSYSTYLDTENSIMSGKALAALITPPISKKEVIEASLSGKLFPHRATRHIIPARPLFINVPLNWLYGKLSLNDANTNLGIHLSKKGSNIYSQAKYLNVVMTKKSTSLRIKKNLFKR